MATASDYQTGGIKVGGHSYTFDHSSGVFTDETGRTMGYNTYGQSADPDMLLLHYYADKGSLPTNQQDFQYWANDRSQANLGLNPDQLQAAGALLPQSTAPANSFSYDAQGNVTNTAPAQATEPTATPGGGTTGAPPIAQGGTVNGNTTPADISTLPPEFQALYSQLNTYLQQLQQRGQVLNPNVEITPAQTAAFLQQAKNEIDPYYQSQLKLATDTLTSSLNYASQQEQTAEQRLQQTYGRSLEGIGSTAADQGFAQSGIRQRNESDLAYNTNNQMQDARNALTQNSNNAARSFAQLWGTNSLPSQLITNEIPRAIAGQPNFAQGGGTTPLYQLSPEVYAGLTGTQQYQQNADVANRASQLESAFRSNQAVDQGRQLTL